MLHSFLLRDSVAFRVDMPVSVQAGQPVPVVLRLTNKTERPLVVALRGRPIAFDVTVARPDGAVVWRRLEGKVVSVIPAVRTLEPAESLTFEAAWDGRAADGAVVLPGQYLVTGTLPTDRPEGLVTRPAALEVLPPPSR